MSFRPRIAPREEPLAKFLMHVLKDYFAHQIRQGSPADTSENRATVRRFYEQESDLPTENLQADIVSSHCEQVFARAEISLVDSPPRFGPEFDLLLACCSNNTVALNRLPALQVNWDRVFRLAEHHRVLPALFSSLRDRDDVPGSIQSAIRARFQKHVHRVLRFSAELA